MKLRIHGNAVRLRLNQAEVAQFSKTGWIEEALEFGPDATLTYTLESLASVPAPRAIFRNGVLKIQVPAGVANEWITTDQVGMRGTQEIAAGKQLAILIEKDFQCAHNPEPDPDAYPNPELETTTTKME